MAIGPPGVGKTDVGRALSQATGRTHLSVSNALREEAGKESDRGKEVNHAIQAGVLVATVKACFIFILPNSIARKLPRLWFDLFSVYEYFTKFISIHTCLLTSQTNLLRLLYANHKR